MAVFISSVLGVREAAGPTSKLAEMDTLSQAIYKGDAEGMAESELRMPIYSGVERRLGSWGSGGVREWSLLRQRKGAEGQPLCGPQPTWGLRGARNTMRGRAGGPQRS